jgi:phosphoglycolate phosphatase-like HAD superfamily hydrolase
MDYKDIDKRKTAFIFELDDVLYPAKDYYFQAYYLFANMLEYIELIDAKAATKVLTDTYIAEGKDAAFDRLAEEFPVAGQYRDKFENLLLTAKLPLKLLLYKKVLTLMQEIVVDRKKLFIVTNGSIQEQINKIKQTEWHGLERYLRCYFTEETAPKPEADVIDLLIQEDDLQRKELVMIGNSEIDKLCAEAAGIDYITVEDFL